MLDILLMFKLDQQQKTSRMESFFCLDIKRLEILCDEIVRVFFFHTKSIFCPIFDIILERGSWSELLDRCWSVLVAHSSVAEVKMTPGRVLELSSSLEFALAFCVLYGKPYRDHNHLLLTYLHTK